MKPSKLSSVNIKDNLIHEYETKINIIPDWNDEHDVALEGAGCKNRRE